MKFARTWNLGRNNQCLLYFKLCNASKYLLKRNLDLKNVDAFKDKKN